MRAAWAGCKGRMNLADVAGRNRIAREALARAIASGTPLPTLHETAQRMWEADSLITLLGKLDADKLPAREGRAVGECQARAVEEWLAAYVDLRVNAAGGKSRAGPRPVGSMPRPG